MAAYATFGPSWEYLKTVNGWEVTSTAPQLTTSGDTKLVIETGNRQRPPVLMSARTPRHVTSREIEYPGLALARGNYKYSGPASKYCTWSSPLDPAVYCQSTGSTNLVNSLLVKVKDQAVNLPVFLAELPETRRMFASLARDMVKTFRTLRSGRGWSTLHELAQSRHPVDKRLAARWLEYQYGWRPLVMEINGLCKQLHKSLDDGVFLTAAVHHADTYSAKSTLGSGSSSKYGSYSAKRDVTVKTSERAVAFYRVRAGNLPVAAQIGLTNPLLLTWELIPLSFVVDWALPVGDFLSALDVGLVAQDLSIQESYKFESELEDTYVWPAAGGKAIVRSSAMASGRKPQVTGTVPRLPQLQPSLSWQRVVSGVSLLRTMR